MFVKTIECVNCDFFRNNFMGWWAKPKCEIIFNYSIASVVLFKINFEWLKVI